MDGDVLERDWCIWELMLPDPLYSIPHGVEDNMNLFIHRSSVHRGVKHIGMQKVNHANTQMKPVTSSLNFLDSLYLRCEVIAITESSKTMQTPLSTKIWTNFPSVKVWRRRVTRQIFSIVFILVNDFSEYTRLKSEIEARAFQPTVYSRPCQKVKEEPFNTCRKKEILRNNHARWLEEESRLYSSSLVVSIIARVKEK